MSPIRWRDDNDSREPSWAETALALVCMVGAAVIILAGLLIWP